MIFSFIPLPPALYRNGRRPIGRRQKVTYPLRRQQPGWLYKVALSTIILKSF